MEKYIKIAEKYLAINSKHLVKGLCFTIRKHELDNSKNPEELIKNKLDSICYDFSVVKSYMDNYGTEYLLFYNMYDSDMEGVKQHERN